MDISLKFHLFQLECYDVEKFGIWDKCLLTDNRWLLLDVRLYRFSSCFHKVKMGFFILTESTLIGRVLYPGFC